MARLSFLGALLLVSFASALGVRLRQDGDGDGDRYGYDSQDGGRNCVNFTIPVSISARQGVFPDIPAKANLEVTDFAQKLVQQGRNYTATILLGYQTVKGNYNISAQYCYPDEVGSTIQILTHGIGFDKTYWDLSFDDYEYSYTNVALEYGYSTLAIDRLGIGNSSHGEPINEIQAPLELEALNAVTTKLRKGEIPEIKDEYEKVIHVGHSFGSVLSYWLSALYPDNTDGLVLTGWSANGSFIEETVAGWNLHSARLNQPFRFGDASNGAIKLLIESFLGLGRQDLVESVVNAIKTYTRNTPQSYEVWNDIQTTEIGDIINEWNTTAVQLNYPPGYITHSDLTSNQFVFLSYGNYDIDLGVVSENTKQPFTIGELLSLGGEPAQSSFEGPVIVFTGQYDQPFCGFDCYATGTAAASIPAEAKKNFPKGGDFEAYIQPDTGHGINVHFNSSAGNAYVQRWLGDHGVGAD